MQNCDGRIPWLEFIKMAEWRMDKFLNQKGSLNLPLWSWFEFRSASEGSALRANGVATSAALVVWLVV